MFELGYVSRRPASRHIGMQSDITYILFRLTTGLERSNLISLGSHQGEPLSSASMVPNSR